MTTPLPYHLHTRMAEFMEKSFSSEEIHSQEDWWEENFPGVSHYWNYTIGQKKYRQCYDYTTDQISISYK